MKLVRSIAIASVLLLFSSPVFAQGFATGLMFGMAMGGNNENVPLRPSTVPLRCYVIADETSFRACAEPFVEGELRATDVLSYDVRKKRMKDHLDWEAAVWREFQRARIK